MKTILHKSKVSLKPYLNNRIAFILSFLLFFPTLGQAQNFGVIYQNNKQKSPANTTDQTSANTTDKASTDTDSTTSTTDTQGTANSDANAVDTKVTTAPDVKASTTNIDTKVTTAPDVKASTINMDTKVTTAPDAKASTTNIDTKKMTASDINMDAKTAAQVNTRATSTVSLNDDSVAEYPRPRQSSVIGIGGNDSKVASKYTLGPQDVIMITVLRHPEVGGKYTLNAEGKIQFEFIGDIQLSGLNKEQVAELIAQRLETYIIKPDVVVKILEYNSKVVYIVGEVGLPGKIFMRGDTITVREALLNAGLPQLTAATESAYLFTPGNGQVERKKVNVYNLLYKGDLRQNYIMKPGDTLYLPPTLWAKVARFLNPITQPVGQAAGSAAAIGAL